MNILKANKVDWKDKIFVRESKGSFQNNRRPIEWWDNESPVRRRTFNTSIEDMISNIGDGSEGDSTGGRERKCLRFTDDVVVLTDGTVVIHRLLL